MHGNKKLWVSIGLAVGFVALGGYHWLNRRRYQANEPLLHDLQAAQLSVAEDQPLGREGDWPQWRRPAARRHRAGKGPADILARSRPAVCSGKRKSAGDFQASPSPTAGHSLSSRTTANEVVICLDAASGKEQWRLAYPSQRTGDPTYGPCAAGNADGGSAIGVYTMGGNGLLAVPGCTKRQADLEARPVGEFGAKLPHWGFACSPLIEGEPGDRAGRRLAGDAVWRFDARRPACLEIAGRPARLQLADCRDHRRADSKLLYSPATRSCGLDPRDGQPLLAISVADSERGERGDTDHPRRLRADLVRIRQGMWPCFNRHGELSAHGGARSTNTTSCAIIFRAAFWSASTSTASRDFTLTCMEFRTGKIAWTKQGMGRGSLLVADGRLVILSESGQVVLAEATPDAFRELASFRFSATEAVLERAGDRAGKIVRARRQPAGLLRSEKTLKSGIFSPLAALQRKTRKFPLTVFRPLL